MPNYIDNFCDIALVVVASELLRRCYRACKEYCCYKKYYMPAHRLEKILKRSFYCQTRTVVFVFIITCTRLARAGIQFPSLELFSYISPLYWLVIAVKLPQSTLDCANWLRSDHCLDYSHGMASNYFHGYLHQTLPSGRSGLHERIQHYEDAENATFALKRLIILIPRQLYIPPQITSNILEKAKPLEIVRKDRAGVERPYKNDVYRFKTPMGEENRFYYIAVEGATPLQSFYEAMNSHLTGTWAMREMQREILLEFYRYLKKLCKESPDIEQAVEIIFYDARDTRGNLMDIGEIILAHLKNLNVLR